jgi:hypothetical protein
MQKMKVKCPNCGRISFETTDQFNPDAIPHGGMVRCLLPYQIDWLCSSTTVSAEMTCPECLAPLVVGGVLNVVMPAREAGECFTDEQKAAIQEAEIQKEMLKTEIPPMEVPEGMVLIDPPGSGPVTETPAEQPKGLVCDVCGKECKSEFGLKSHKRSHK